MGTLTNNFSGRTIVNKRIPRHKGVKVANTGFQFDHATEAFFIGLRQDAKFVVKTKKVTDWAGRGNTDAVDVELTASVLQTSFAYLKNYYLLSKNYHQLQVQSQSGEYYNFVRNANGSVNSPNGSNEVGLTWKFTLTDKERKAELKWKTQVFGPQWSWVLTNLGTPHAGGSGGTALGLTAMAYDVTQYVRSNVLWIAIAGYEAGDFKEFKLEIDFEGDEDNRTVPYSNKTKHKFEATLLQASAVEGKAALEAGNKDIDIVIRTANDESIQYTQGAMILEFSYESDDKGTYLKLMGECEVPFNFNEAAPNAIIWGASSLEFRLIGTGLV